MTATLYEAGEGIFGTHVTWNDIEIDMQKALGTKATFGSNKKVSNIGDGNGFLSKICLVEADWQEVQDDEVLPSKFVAKLCTSVTMVDLLRKMENDKSVTFITPELLGFLDTRLKTLHNIEVHIYKLLSDYNNKAIPRAKVYLSKPFSEENPLKGCLMMEYVDNISLVHLYHSLNPEELHQPLRAIASLETLSLKLTEKEKSCFTRNPITEIFGHFFDEKDVESMRALLTGYGGARMEKLIAELLEILPELLDTKWIDSIPDQIGMERILCHGDLWCTNILWRKVPKGHKMIAMLDFQTCHMGNAAIDLGRLLHTHLTGKDRLKDTDNLLDTFYGFLKEEIGGDHPMPYSLDQLKEAYRRFQPTAAYRVIPMLGSMLDSIMSEEDRLKAMDVVDEKLEAMIKELLENHARNKAIRAKTTDENKILQ